jgi:hypothetical protein
MPPPASEPSASGEGEQRLVLHGVSYRDYVLLDFEMLAAHVLRPDQDAAVRACWEHLQKTGA